MKKLGYFSASVLFIAAPLALAASCGQSASATPGKALTVEYPQSNDVFVPLLANNLGQIQLEGNMHDVVINEPRSLTYTNDAGLLSESGTVQVATIKYRLKAAGVNPTFLPKAVFQAFMAERLVWADGALFEQPLDGARVDLTARYQTSFGFADFATKPPAFNENLTPLLIEAHYDLLPGFYADAQEVVRAVKPTTLNLAPFLKASDYYRHSQFSFTSGSSLNLTAVFAAQLKTYFEDAFFTSGPYVSASDLPANDSASWVSVKAYGTTQWDALESLNSSDATKRWWVRVVPKASRGAHQIDQAIFDLTDILAVK